MHCFDLSKSHNSTLSQRSWCPLLENEASEGLPQASQEPMQQLSHIVAGFVVQSRYGIAFFLPSGDGHWLPDIFHLPMWGISLTIGAHDLKCPQTND